MNFIKEHYKIMLFIGGIILYLVIHHFDPDHWLAYYLNFFYMSCFTNFFLFIGTILLLGCVFNRDIMSHFGPGKLNINEIIVAFSFMCTVLESIGLFNWI